MADNTLTLRPADGAMYAALTIDNLSAGDGHRLARVLDWLDELDLKVTFFVIPYSYQNRMAVCEDPAMVEQLTAARRAGHEVLPHGYEHELFECGIPDLLTVRDEAMMNSIARVQSREMFQLRHQHARGRIGAMLDKSMRIFDSLFKGEAAPTGFRAGYHAFCRGLYFALEDLGVKWSSTRSATPSAWRRQGQGDPTEVVPWVGLHPYWVGGILEVPHLTDYGYRLQPDEVEGQQKLAVKHLELCQRIAAPFVAVTTYRGMRGEDGADLGFGANKQVVQVAREQFGCQFVPLGAIAAAALATPDRWPSRDEFRR